ncbi:uncharacterized protein YkwD [Constrictibacter sp. MBR-5]|uniref:CAP domain-containing protein n=1 Tax=Constrictibacter sp. MBR-5 TaxID=3156467 RepID=UPI003394EAED
MRRTVMAALSAACLAAAALPAATTRPAQAQDAAPDLASLRQEALSLVNEARRDNGLGPLTTTGPLNRAAQAHADDMLKRGYYSHESPDGRNVADRFQAEGGSQWKLTAENIAQCEGCRDLSRERVRQFQQGWMNSPDHRANILRAGLTEFGFGIAGRDGKILAVQTFAGPGEPRGTSGEASAPAISAEAAAAAALAAINQARREAGAPPLEASDALDTVAQRLLEGDTKHGIIRQPANLLDLLPAGERQQWRRLDVLAAACGGCGTRRTKADVTGFAEQWLNDSGYRQRLLEPGTTHLGFFLVADGDGRKRAAAVAGRREE